MKGLQPISNTIHEDLWAPLRAYTAARIALGRTGVSVPVKESLNFKLAHAHARDAVYSVLDVDMLIAHLKDFKLPVYLLHSKAKDRYEYIQRPDLGRQLNESSVMELQENKQEYDIALMLSDGLSATAINQHAMPLLELLIPAMQSMKFKIAPLSIVLQARVAIGDEIGSLQHAKITVLCIGERPGLSSPDSMGVYITYEPRVGLTDESRNCISNIRPEGLAYNTATQKTLYLVKESLRLKLSGFGLKDNAGLLL